jgi:hypothetical protein
VISAGPGFLAWQGLRRILAATASKDEDKEEDDDDKEEDDVLPAMVKQEALVPDGYDEAAVIAQAMWKSPRPRRM